jgi:hypothetical protein
MKVRSACYFTCKRKQHMHALSLLNIGVVFVLRNICHAPRSGDAIILVMTELKSGAPKKAGMGQVVDGEVRMPAELRGEAVQANTKEVGDYIMITGLRLMRGYPAQKVSVRACAHAYNK